LASFWFVVVEFAVRRKKKKTRAGKKRRGMVDALKWARAPVTPLLLQPQRVRAVRLRAENEHKKKKRRRAKSTWREGSDPGTKLELRRLNGLERWNVECDKSVARYNNIMVMVVRGDLSWRRWRS
jgi:hypothetical protein